MSDPRTLWKSADGVWAVATQGDIPMGVKVGTYYYPNQLAECAAGSWGSYPNRQTAGSNYIAKCRTLDLPWEGTTMHTPLIEPVRYNAVMGRMEPVKKVVKVWPLPCPKCGKPDAAVVLFSSTECRFGCFARGAS